MKTILFFFGAVLVVCCIIVAFLAWKNNRKPQKRVPSGKYLPSDRELLRMNTERLQNFLKEDLLWLEDYVVAAKNKSIAASKTAEAESWDDLLRRIDIVLNGF